MPENSHGEPVGFRPQAPPDHIARLDRDDANELIEYAIRCRPEPYPRHATLIAFILFIAAAGLGTVVLLSYHRVEPSISVFCAAVSGWLVRTGAVATARAGHARANEVISEILIEYGRRMINGDR